MDYSKLAELIHEGEIDTVLVVFPDMQGRLMGKRVTGHFFLDVANQEVHACDYLLATDMEMQTVAGYRAASWDQGYGDFTLTPDLDTLRTIGWLDGTALVLSDVTDHHGKLLPHAPRSILKAQLARLADRGLTAKVASQPSNVATDAMPVAALETPPAAELEPAAAPESVPSHDHQPEVSDQPATLTIRLRNRRAHCAIKVCGRRVGRTPMFLHEVPVGTHWVEVSCKKGRRFSQQMEFVAGDEQVLLLGREDLARSRRGKRAKRRWRRSHRRRR